MTAGNGRERVSTLPTCVWTAGCGLSGGKWPCLAGKFDFNCYFRTSHSMLPVRQNSTALTLKDNSYRQGACSRLQIAEMHASHFDAAG